MNTQEFEDLAEEVDLFYDPDGKVDKKILSRFWNNMKRKFVKQYEEPTHPNQRKLIE